MGIPYAEVIGDPIAHSKSPLIHKYWLEKLGIEGDYRSRHVGADKLHLYFAERRSDADWRGCNVTLPHKVAVVPFMGRLSRTARKSGAVNTIVAEADGTRKGHNTDALAIAALLRGFGRRPYPNYVATYVQVIGAGGAARAAITGAVEAGHGDFDFFNRTLEGARALAALLGLNPDAFAAPLDGLGPIRNPDDGPDDQRYSHVIVNASSMGMDDKPDVPIDLAAYYPDTIVIDLAYGSQETRLVRQARALDLRVADGLDVLVEQAALAFELFYGAPPPREADGPLRELLTS
jgi:shikimate dehydrogenase